MTSSNKPTLSIDEILDDFRGGGEYFGPNLTKKQAKQQLSTLIASIIGEDFDPYYTNDNAILAEQRQRAKDLGIDL